MRKPLFIKWNESHNIGVDLIDEQHQGIVSIINTFYYMMDQGADHSRFYLSIIATLNNYSRIHFVTEEEFMAAAGYQNLENHKKLHQALLMDMERLERGDLQFNGAKLLLDFLKKWWLEHIREQDLLYMPHLLAYERRAD